MYNYSLILLTVNAYEGLVIILKSTLEMLAFECSEKDFQYYYTYYQTEPRKVGRMSFESS